MGRMKTYKGSDLVQTYISGSVSKNDSNLRNILNPSSLDSLQIWFDAVENTVTADGSDQVTSISNSGIQAGNFTFYPNTGTFNPAKKANFVQGTGNTKYYKFEGDSTNTMHTVYIDTPSFTPKTIISIAKKVSTGDGTPYALWNVPTITTWNGFTGLYHPLNRTSLDIEGAIYGGATITASPSSSLGQYTYGEDNYTFFAWSSDDYYFFPTDSKFQTNKTNSTTVTYNNNPGTYDLAQFVINVGEDRSPGVGSTGVNHHVAEMVFDTVLSPKTIAGIYNYYKIIRGYNIY